jgi:hypothetical protein
MFEYPDHQNVAASFFQTQDSTLFPFASRIRRGFITWQQSCQLRPAGRYRLRLLKHDNNFFGDIDKIPDKTRFP